MVKAHQDEGNGKQLDFLVRGDVRQGLSLNRPRILKGNEEETSVQVPESGKPDAVKVARPVWNGGKAARPYLSLRAFRPDPFSVMADAGQPDVTRPR